MTTVALPPYLWKRFKGFGIIEVILVIGALGALSSVSVPVYLDYQVRNDLNLAMEQATQGLREAQIKSQAGEGTHGFFVPAGTLYKGESYATRDAAQDTVYPMPSTITVSGSILEVSFSRDGKPSQSGYITLTDLRGEQRLITILVPEEGIPTNESDKLKICHQVGGGEQHTLTISDNAWPAHYDHGDMQGPCPGDETSSSSSSSSSSSTTSSSVSSSSSSSSSAGGGSSSSATCEDRFEVSENGLIVATGPVDVTFTVLGSEITYGEGGPEVNVYLKYTKNGGNSWSNLFNGNDVDGGETKTISATSGNVIGLRARGYYKKNGWLTFDRTYDTIDDPDHMVVLRDGELPPDYPVFDDQDSLADFLGDLLDENGRIDIDTYDVVVIGEIGVQNLQSNSAAVDFQDIVVLIEFDQEAGSCN